MTVLAREGFHKSYHRGDIGVAQILPELILTHRCDSLLKGLETSVVEVWCGELNVAQGRYLELVQILFPAAEALETVIVGVVFYLLGAVSKVVAIYGQVLE